MESVAFFGLGMKGQGMALRLLVEAAGLSVYNRTEDKAKPVVKKGAELFRYPIAAVQSSTVLITMLSDGDAREFAIPSIEVGIRLHNLFLAL
jgi:3-hydroxyisobutyrate dehydrogenase